MSSERRRLAFQASLLKRLQDAGLEVCAWVVLPNHYHILALVPDFDKVAGAFQHLHGSSSRQWNLEDDTIGRKVWYRYSDRAMRGERHVYTTINYLHYNPVKHGYAKRADEWVCTSIWRYLEMNGREWLAELWREYPVRDYGRAWDW